MKPWRKRRYHPLVELMQGQYRMGDILANAITHGVGAALAIVGATLLVVMAALHGTVWHVASCAVFGATLALVYICSTLYHSLVLTPARRIFHILDHSAIYLLIAGTYTPFTLVSLHGRLGWTLFAAQWGLALAGVAFKCAFVGRYEVLSLLVYLCQGWMAALAVVPLYHALSWQGMAWLGAGGLAYTLGVIFYALDRLPYFHAAWHIFVMAGSVAHFFAILFYVVPSMR